MKRLGPIWKFISRNRIWRWWTLENWRKSTDLLVKFATVLGVLVVANFFVITPQFWQAESFQLVIDKSKVEEFYEEPAEIPQTIVDIINHYSPRDQDPFWHPSDNSFMRGTRLYEDIQSSLTNLSAEAENMIRSYYGYANGFWNDSWYENVPSYALWLALSFEELGGDKISYALRAIESSKYTIAKIVVQNTGSVLAREITILPPEGFTKVDTSPDPFDLPVGAVKGFLYRTDYGEEEVDSTGIFETPIRTEKNMFVPRTVIYEELAQFPGADPDTSGKSRFFVFSKSPGVLDTDKLFKIGIAFLVLWFAIILKEIIWPSPGREDVNKMDLLNRARLLRAGRKKRSKS